MFIGLFYLVLTLYHGMGGCSNTLIKEKAYNNIFCYMVPCYCRCCVMVIYQFLASNEVIVTRSSEHMFCCYITYECNMGLFNYSFFDIVIMP